MASKNKTPLGFNEWVLSDKPRMEDFNRDNKLADKLIMELREELAKKADKIPPQKYELSLSGNITKYHTSHYFKTDDNVVTVNVSFKTTEDITDNQMDIAVLPAGFRPSENIEVPINIRGGNTNATITFRTNGTVGVYPQIKVNSNTLCFVPTVSFIAAQ